MLEQNSSTVIFEETLISDENLFHQKNSQSSVLKKHLFFVISIVSKLIK